MVVVDDLSTGNADAVPAGARFVHDDMVAAAPGLLGGGSFDGVLHFAAKSLVGESVVAPSCTGSATWSRPWSCSRPSGSPAPPAGVLLDRGHLRRAGVGADHRGCAHPADERLRGHQTGDRPRDHVLRRRARPGRDQPALLQRRRRLRRLGERHATETHLIPLVLQVALGLREEISVFGDDWPTPDGTCIRDYIHVRDLADAHVLALATAQPGAHGIYNLGNGTGFSVREVIACCERVTGGPIAARDVERRAGDPAVLIASSEKAITELGWRPRHPPSTRSSPTLGSSPARGPSRYPSFASVRVCTATRRGTGHSGHARCPQG